MALGEGITWNETVPTNDTVANQIDDYMRDMMLAVRQRMANEHVWPSSQTGTAEAGQHRYISFVTQTSSPVVATTYGGILYVSTNKSLIFVNSDSSENVIIASGTAAGRLRALTFFVSGDLTTGTNVSARLRLPVGGLLKSAYAYVDEAPVASNVIIDIAKDGASIWAGTTADMLTIVAATTAGSELTIATTAATAGALFSVDLIQVGSGGGTSGGSDLTIVLNVQETG